MIPRYQLSIAGLRLLPSSLSAAVRDPRNRRDLKKEGRLFSSSPLPSFLCAPAHSTIAPPIGWICCSCHYAHAHCPTPLPIDSICRSSQSQLQTRMAEAEVCFQRQRESKLDAKLKKYAYLSCLFFLIQSELLQVAWPRRDL